MVSLRTDGCVPDAAFGTPAPRVNRALANGGTPSDQVFAGFQYRHTKPGLTHQAGPGNTVVVLANSGLVALDGCSFVAQSEGKVIARKGSCGQLLGGSVGLAEAGSKVTGCGGSVIFARKGSWVRPIEGDTVFHELGAEIVAAVGARLILVAGVLEFPYFSGKHAFELAATPAAAAVAEELTA